MAKLDPHWIADIVTLEHNYLLIHSSNGHAPLIEFEECYVSSNFASRPMAQIQPELAHTWPPSYLLRGPPPIRWDGPPRPCIDGESPKLALCLSHSLSPLARSPCSPSSLSRCLPWSRHGRPELCPIVALPAMPQAQPPLLIAPRHPLPALLAHAEP
jgi:hypothetical protein